ncbi:hypothetical protein pdam_00022914, partial [Pocillopora damicornis]
MGSLLREEFSKAGGSSEKDSATARAIKTQGKPPDELTNFSVAAHLKQTSERNTRGNHPFKFVILRTKKYVCKISFFPRTINE